MKNDEKNNNTGSDHEQQVKTDNTSSTRHEDEDQHSYQGKLDQVEGRMQNGEIGGGIRKESGE